MDEKPLLAVILTDGNTPGDQLAAGEALMRLMLEAAALGLATCPLSQAVDMPVFRSRLKTLMGWATYPQMMVRIGNRPAGRAAPLTLRRPLADVLRHATN
jgi:nitroreductase